jgi:UDP-glucose 6-dehydrogenase
MKLTVVGSGYVELVTAACFSFAGHPHVLVLLVMMFFV